ncbi:hypothetical protein [Methanospirillum sp.]|uniref:hypothetical protein n=1 Tax=Methanospirillum sp. TaxID=45200 RepID=UPI002985DDCE|nr:hypothetical protein [Methanospirillum sp.]
MHSEKKKAVTDYLPDHLISSDDVVPGLFTIHTRGNFFSLLTISFRNSETLGTRVS